VRIRLSAVATDGVGIFALVSDDARVRSPWRWSAAALLVVAVAAHVPVTGEHLAEAPYLGWAFVGFEVVGTLLAVALLVQDRHLVWSTAGLLAALALAAYACTRLVAFPQLADDVGNWREPLGVVCVVTEALLVAVASMHRTRVPGPSLTARLLAAVVLVLGALATTYAATVGG
jgi:hypothetical protein